MLPQICVFTLLGREVRIEVFKLLCRNKADVSAQSDRQLRILPFQEIERAAYSGHNALHGILQRIQRTLILINNLFPVPLIDIDGVQVIQILVTADGVHVGIEAFTQRESVIMQSLTLPFCQ